MNRETLRHALALAKKVSTPIALTAIAVAAWRNRETLSALVSSARTGRLVLAAGIWTALQFLSPFFILRVFSRSEVTLTYGKAFTIHANRLPARYLPGGIWHSVGRAADYHELGVGTRNLVLLFFLENALGPASAFFLGGLLLLSQKGMSGWGRVGALAAGVGAVGLLIAPIIAKRFILAGERLSLSVYAGTAALTSLFWCGAATAFVTYVSAFHGNLTLISPLETAGTYLFAWAVGNVTVFAPQGLGVFEMVAGSILRGTLPLGGAAALMAGFRVVVLFADLAAWSLAHLGRIISCVSHCGRKA